MSIGNPITGSPFASKFEIKLNYINFYSAPEKDKRHPIPRVVITVKGVLFGAE
ncbi:hypothetical protein SAMN05216334_10634 [Nitrosomonas ureae]|uniref:Uncharacterized protein n=1 Tax=Nitrosomonas ureae TaxID=44577 RepID=A0A1H5TYN4_9PROT|nr:hypothetical protein SAMN05216334_10634 [Nitrosomonas ureae]